MICKHCNADNSDGAIFCHQCGNTLTGICCPECNTNNKDGSLYCVNCGARLDGVKTCKYCGAELETKAKFCTMCGKRSETPAEPATKSSSSKNSNDVVRGESAIQTKLTKIFRISANALGIAIAALTIIFTLFMGTKLVVPKELQEYTGTSDSYNVFYYFGDAFSEVRELADYWQDRNATTIALMYIKATFGLIISVSTIITVLILGIIGIVRSAKSIKSDKINGSKSVAAFLAFAIGATLLLVINNSLEVMKEGRETEKMYYQFNGAAMAGLVLVGILVGLYAVLSILANGTKQINKSFIVNGSVALGSLLFAIICVGLFSNTFFNMSASEYGSSVTYGYNHFGLMSICAGYADRYIDTPNAFIIAIVLALFSFITTAITLIMLMQIIASGIKDVATGKTSEMKGAMAKSIVAVIFSVVTLVLLITAVSIFNSELIRLSNYSVFDNFDKSYATPIAILVMSIITLGVEIARKVLKNKFTYEE